MAVIRCPNCRVDISLKVTEHTVKPRIKEIVLDLNDKCFKHIPNETMEYWATTYPTVNLEDLLKETARYWLSKSRQQWKKDWRQTIENRIRWCSDHGMHLIQLVPKDKVIYYICDRCGKKLPTSQICNCTISSTAIDIKNIMGGTIVVDK